MTVYLIDTSDYDWTRGPFDVVAMVADGMVGLTHKATEAANVRHVHLADALNRARTAGLSVLGAYHVVRSAPSVSAQVSYFFAYLDQAVPWWRTWPGFILQVDLEKWSYDPVTYKGDTSMAQAFGRYGRKPTPMGVSEKLRAAGTGASFVSELLARKPSTAFVVLYASKGQYGDTLAGVGVPLWNANYPSSRAAPYRTLYPGDSGIGWSAYSGQTPMLWQYASTATIGTQSGCDVNAFRGTVQQLRSAIGTKPAPIPTMSGDRMLLLVHVNGKPAVADGMTCRVITDADVDNLRWLSNHGAIGPLGNNGQFWGGDYTAAFGVVVSTEPVQVSLSAEDLATLAADLAAHARTPLGAEDEPAIKAALADVISNVGLHITAVVPPPA
jgi:hypothetical protein